MSHRKPDSYFTDKKDRTRPIFNSVGQDINIHKPNSSQLKKSYSTIITANQVSQLTETYKSDYPLKNLVIRGEKEGTGWFGIGVEDTRVWSADLDYDGFADAGIVPYINEINRAGIDTNNSCSGMQKDHFKNMGNDIKYTQSYLSITLPKSVAQTDILSFTKNLDELKDYEIKDRDYLNALIEAGEKANWTTKTGRVFGFLPEVDYRMPRTGSVENDKKVYNSVEYLQIQHKIEGLIGKDSGDFLKAIKERDLIERKLLKKYTIRDNKSYSDEELDRAWKNLSKSLTYAMKNDKRLSKTILPSDRW